MIEQRINGSEKAPWLRCRGCKASYWAENWHCQRCHETLDHKTDWHIVDGICVPPSRVGWESNHGVWQER